MTMRRSTVTAVFTAIVMATTLFGTALAAPEVTLRDEKTINCTNFREMREITHFDNGSTFTVVLCDRSQPIGMGGSFGGGNLFAKVVHGESVDAFIDDVVDPESIR